MDLIEKVNQYVENQLNDYHPQQSRAPKVIHDTILGSNLFLPYEIILIDSPIVQRLRNISQVDVAPLIFPSGNHNRFEHTLGVAVIAQKMVDAIWNRVSEEEHGVIVEMGKDYILSHVRFAAILHDCGHSAFSHLTEDVFSQCEDFK
ncbi:MAG: HD domain-containing protein [Oscillospiraceae bacterium]|jgi:HD superfamily phosphohydrolase|nr:HD domain-containing protein [Oscillospiraceae bacterium]